MKVTTQEFENGQAVLRIEVEPAEMEESLEEAYRSMAKRMNVPGFRKGKAPRSILESYVGKDGLQQEALEHLIPRLCSQAAEEQKLDVIAQPEVEILEGDPVAFKATYPLRPKVELGDYRSVRLDPEPVEATEEQIEAVMQQLREQHAVWIPAERPLDFGDMATINIEQKREGADPTGYEGQQLPIIQNSKLPLPGFAEELIGMNKDEEKEFSLSFPEDYEVKGLANQKYDFKVKLTELKEKQLPELDDEFAKSLGQDVETVDALRDKVTDGLKTAAEQRAKRDFERKVVEAVVGIAEVEFPPVLVEREIDHLMRERDVMFRGQGGLEAYLKSINKTEEEIREELRPSATERLVQSLVLGKMAEEETIEATDSEVDAEVEKSVQDAYDYNKDELRSLFSTPGGRRAIWEELIVRKTIERLAEIASGSVSEGETAEQEVRGEGETEAGEEGPHEEAGPEEETSEGRE